jgi:hypothetical protein
MSFFKNEEQKGKTGPVRGMCFLVASVARQLGESHNRKNIASLSHLM